jgi:hypothetical protein
MNDLVFADPENVPVSQKPVLVFSGIGDFGICLPFEGENHPGNERICSRYEVRYPLYHVQKGRTRKEVPLFRRHGSAVS